mmetsp:Transcript_30668/g.77524  ORF Transcript_30668/g.77524 Transcript_30668/m.77524 type:complete len:92 (-) Transcript_30668:704-979(-)
MAHHQHCEQIGEGPVCVRGAISNEELSEVTSVTGRYVAGAPQAATSAHQGGQSSAFDHHASHRHAESSPAWVMSGASAAVAQAASNVWRGH